MTPHIAPDLDHFRDDMLAHGLMPNTIKQRLSFAQRFANDWGTWSVPAARIAEWLHNFTGWTRVTYYSHLRGLFDWLTRSGRVAEDPTRLLRRPKQPRPHARPLTMEMLDAAFDAAAGTDVFTYLALGYLQGLRASEIASMHGRDIIDGTHLRVVDGKGGYEDHVPLHSVVAELAQIHPTDGYWFPTPGSKGARPITGHTVTVKVSKLLDTFGVRGSIHRTRHSYGTHLVENGNDINIVRSLLRHRNLNTTQLYLFADETKRGQAISELRLPGTTRGPV